MNTCRDMYNEAETTLKLGVATQCISAAELKL